MLLPRLAFAIFISISGPREFSPLFERRLRKLLPAYEVTSWGVSTQRTEGTPQWEVCVFLHRELAVYVTMYSALISHYFQISNTTAASTTLTTASRGQ